MNSLKRTATHFRLNQESGFTLTEMLIVITLIALVGTFAVTQILDRYDRARTNATKVQMQNLGVVLDNLRLDCGRYPTSEEGLEALVEKPASLKCEGYERNGYVKNGQLPKDGFDKPFQYISENGSDYELISLGKDGREGGENYDKDISSKGEKAKPEETVE